MATSLIDDGRGANNPVAFAIVDALAMGTRRPANWRLLAGCALAGFGLACATGPAPGILPTAEIMRHLERRLELRDEEPALRLTKPGGRHPIYLTGRELEDGAVVVLEVRF
ncbi:MAG: hypothetical protein JRS35_15520 [Deltaproteobacteria bacterium]|nr:hypothetical protein [Deltaproteobacteria bacterium]